jgi:hypothetical protein
MKAHKITKAQLESVIRKNNILSVRKGHTKTRHMRNNCVGLKVLFEDQTSLRCHFVDGYERPEVYLKKGDVVIWFGFLTKGERQEQFDAWLENIYAGEQS